MTETLTEVRLSQARTETTLKAVVKLQEKHEEQINNPRGKISLLEQEIGNTNERIDGVTKAVESIKIYLGLIAVGITIIINFTLDWFWKIFE